MSTRTDFAELKRRISTTKTTTTNTTNNTNDSANEGVEFIRINKTDFFYMCDQLVLVKNDNYVLRQRVLLLENVVKWCLQFLTFVHSFSNLVFQNNLPLSAVILKTDLFDIPFMLINQFEKYITKTRELFSETYNHYKLLDISLENDFKQLNFAPQIDDTSDFLKYVETIRVEYDKFAREFNNSANEFFFPSPFTNMDSEKQVELVNILTLVLKKFNLELTPQYLLKQNYLAERTLPHLH